MNLDNQRLKDIQILKKGYGLKVLAAESKEEVEHYYSKIDELTAEETEILKRCDVIIWVSEPGKKQNGKQLNVWRMYRKPII